MSANNISGPNRRGKAVVLVQSPGLLQVRNFHHSYSINTLVHIREYVLSRVGSVIATSAIKYTCAD